MRRPNMLLWVFLSHCGPSREKSGCARSSALCPGVIRTPLLENGGKYGRISWIFHEKNNAECGGRNSGPWRRLFLRKIIAHQLRACVTYSLMSTNMGSLDMMSLTFIAHRSLVKWKLFSAAVTHVCAVDVLKRSDSADLAYSLDEYVGPRSPSPPRLPARTLPRGCSAG